MKKFIVIIIFSYLLIFSFGCSCLVQSVNFTKSSYLYFKTIVGFSYMTRSRVVNACYYYDDDSYHNKYRNSFWDELRGPEFELMGFLSDLLERTPERNKFSDVVEVVWLGKKYYYLYSYERDCVTRPISREEYDTIIEMNNNYDVNLAIEKIQKREFKKTFKKE